MEELNMSDITEDIKSQRPLDLSHAVDKIIRLGDKGDKGQKSPMAFVRKLLARLVMDVTFDLYNDKYFRFFQLGEINENTEFEFVILNGIFYAELRLIEENITHAFAFGEYKVIIAVSFDQLRYRFSERSRMFIDATFFKK